MRNATDTLDRVGVRPFRHLSRDRSAADVDAAATACCGQRTAGERQAGANGDSGPGVGRRAIIDGVGAGEHGHHDPGCGSRNGCAPISVSTVPAATPWIVVAVTHLAYCAAVGVPELL